MELRLRYFGYSCDHNNYDSSGVTCIYCGLSMKVNMCEKSHGLQDKSMHMRKKDHGRNLVFICSLVCGRQGTKYP